VSGTDLGTTYSLAAALERGQQAADHVVQRDIRRR
jgi:hypothetical protein